MRFFAKLRQDDLEQCVAVLEPEDVRAEFELAFRRFARAWTCCSPTRRAAVRWPTWGGWARSGTPRARYRDESLDISDCGEKVRALIEERDRRRRRRSARAAVHLGAEFEEKIRKLGSNEARASEMEHAIRHEIHVKLDEDPAFYSSLRERLETDHRRPTAGAHRRRRAAPTAGDGRAGTEERSSHGRVVRPRRVRLRHLRAARRRG